MLEKKRRWVALWLLCLGELMIVLDTTVVNVALPSIRTDLGFSEAALVWVINAYMVTYGGFLLLGGRLGDLYGNRRLFLAGIVGFTIASVGCGLATSQALLIAARAVQGLGGAVVSAVALSLIMNLFTEADERAKAMGFYGFVCAGGGSLGVLLGGAITDTLSWHWVFLINVPIGAAVYAFCVKVLPETRGQRMPLDVGGAVTVTGSSMLAVYGIVETNGLALAGSAVLLAAFLFIESRVAAPLMPLRLFRVRSVWISNVAGALWAASMFACFFVSALYLQLVLGYGAMQVGLAFLPSNLIMAAFSLGLSAKVVMRFGLRAPIAAGLGLAAAGLALFARAPVEASFLVDVLPGMLLIGVGCGMALNPVLLAAMGGVAPEESGLASGIVNTSFMVGGALGLAVLASLAASRTGRLLAAGAGTPVALNSGYHAAFLVAAVFALAASLLAGFLLNSRERRTEWASQSSTGN